MFIPDWDLYKSDAQLKRQVEKVKRFLQLRRTIHSLIRGNDEVRTNGSDADAGIVSR